MRRTTIWIELLCRRCRAVLIFCLLHCHHNYIFCRTTLFSLNCVLNSLEIDFIEWLCIRICLIKMEQRLNWSVWHLWIEYHWCDWAKWMNEQVVSIQWNLRELMEWQMLWIPSRCWFLTHWTTLKHILRH